jgi:DNA-binding response OmpR family regulator
MLGKILLIDDNLELRVCCRDYLREQNYDVEDCGSGMEALNRIKKQNYDVIITDNQMPGILGINLIPSLKKTGAKIIFISGSFVKDIVIQANKLGVDKMLCKNFTPADLDGAIANCLYEKAMEENPTEETPVGEDDSSKVA